MVLGCTQHVVARLALTMTMLKVNVKKVYNAVRIWSASNEKSCDLDH